MSVKDEMIEIAVEIVDYIEDHPNWFEKSVKEKARRFYRLWRETDKQERKRSAQ